MTKIYEALEKAKGGNSVAPESGVIHFPREAIKRTSRTSKSDPVFIALCKNLVALLPEKRCRIIQFIEIRNSNGAGALVRQLSKTCAYRLKQRVLLLDASNRRPSQAERFNVYPALDWETAAQQQLPVKETLCQVAQSSLFVSQFAFGKSTGETFSESKAIDIFLEELKSMFSAVFISGPAMDQAPDVSLLSKNVDGVVLVVEAERTRWQVADKIKQRISEQGGNVLGVVLNKQRHPIPGFIYNRI